MKKFFTAFGFAGIPFVAQAALPPVSNGGILPGPSSAASGISYVVHNLLPAVTNWVLVAIMALGVLVIIVGGLMMIFGAGDSEKQKTARDTITWGIIGVVIAMLAYAIVKAIIFINFFGY